MRCVDERRQPKLLVFPVLMVGDKVTRDGLTDHTDLKVVVFSFHKQGAEGTLYNDPHIQSTFVESC